MAYRRLIWPVHAVLDLEEIVTNVAADSPEAARAVVRRIMEATRRLREFPLSGRVVAAFGLPTVREILVQDYRVVYELVDDAVEIWMVIHTRRHFPPIKVLDRKTFL